MGSAAISVLGGVLPLEVNFIFFVLVGVIGYGIYLPYQEKRKYGSSQPKQKEPRVPKAEGKVDGRTIGALILSVFLGCLLLWGLGWFFMALIFAPLIGGTTAVVLVVLGGLMVVLLAALLWRVVRSLVRGGRKKTERTSPASAPKRALEHHAPLTSTAPSVQKQLEQLKVLKEAGLIDNTEYERRKKMILKGM